MHTIPSRAMSGPQGPRAAAWCLQGSEWLFIYTYIYYINAMIFFYIYQHDINNNEIIFI